MLLDGATPAAAQRPTLSRAVQAFVAIDTPVVALTHVRVIDGTGAAAREDQTIVVREGRIATIGDANTSVPASARVLDLTGKTVMPGLVMVHEHLHYPTGPGVYGNLAESFTRLYLAGGVTSMRTAGNMSGYGEINVRQQVERGERAGPWIDATAPNIVGRGFELTQLYTMKDAADVRRFVRFWHDAGATSLKVFTHVTRDMLGAAISEGHKHGMKVTGHLCSITHGEAARLGIDNIEHGFYFATDFVAARKPDVCPSPGDVQASLLNLDPRGSAIASLIGELVQRNVAVTSTLPVLETITPGRPLPPGLDVLVPQLREQFEQRHAAIARNTTAPSVALFARARQMEIDFFRAGGLLIAGTDPTGIGGVVPGFANQREVELLVEGGLTPLEAIRVSTLNGATYLGRASVTGSIVTGKQADLVIIDGDPSTRIEDIRNISLVFKQGVAYDPLKLINSVKGRVGLY